MLRAGVNIRKTAAGQLYMNSKKPQISNLQTKAGPLYNTISTAGGQYQVICLMEQGLAECRIFFKIPSSFAGLKQRR
ncbi:hypothetical protein CS542_06775 [Pedobacter sp. IW39]|nr:hypothetical protein CS542_06775 [Pedobacter sp. IW39]